MVRCRKRLLVLFFFFVLCISILAYARYIEPFLPRTEQVEITSPCIGENADGLRIVVFADTHFGEYYSTKNFQKVLGRIKAQDPDMVFFLGDLIDHYDEYAQTESVEEISRLLSEIEAPLGKYAIFGNHDYGGGAENSYEDVMEAGGFRVLVNEALTLEEQGIRLIGIDDILIGYGDPETAKKADQSLFNIVLAHEPDVVDKILTSNFDLILAGHTHGRQINLSIFDDYILPTYGREYIHGLYALSTPRNASLYVNAGIGMTQLPLRLGSPPELTVVTLCREP